MKNNLLSLRIQVTCALKLNRCETSPHQKWQSNIANPSQNLWWQNSAKKVSHLTTPRYKVMHNLGRFGTDFNRSTSCHVCGLNNKSHDLLRLGPNQTMDKISWRRSCRDCVMSRRSVTRLLWFYHRRVNLERCQRNGGKRTRARKS